MGKCSPVLDPVPDGVNRKRDARGKTEGEQLRGGDGQLRVGGIKKKSN